MKIRSNPLCGSILLVLVILYLAEATRFTTGFIADPIGPKGFPYVLGAAAVMLCLRLILRPEDDVRWPQRSFWWKYAFLAALLFGYSWMLVPLGFIPSTFLMITVLAVALGATPIKAAPFGLAFSILVHVLFRLLALPLPGGTLYQALWTGTGL
jgi:putative tricarboxylic transport membrane protein